MKNKKNYNNLFDSICMTLFLILIIALYSLAIWFGVINHNEGTDPIAALIAFSLFFGIISITTIIFIVLYCYEYWVLTDNRIFSKKMFRKKVEITLEELEKVEKKMVPALILGIYKSDAYIIYSNCKKIVILKNKRNNLFDLEYELSKHVNT